MSKMNINGIDEFNSAVDKLIAKGASPADAAAKARKMLAAQGKKVAQQKIGDTVQLSASKPLTLKQFGKLSHEGKINHIMSATGLDYAGAEAYANELTAQAKAAATVKKAGKGVKKGAAEVGSKVKKGAENVGNAVKKGAAKVGSKVKKGAEKAGKKITEQAKTMFTKAKDFVGKHKVASGIVAGLAVIGTIGAMIASNKSEKNDYRDAA